MFAVAVCLHLTYSHVKSVIEENCENLVWKKPKLLSFKVCTKTFEHARKFSMLYD